MPSGFTSLSSFSTKFGCQSKKQSNKKESTKNWIKKAHRSINIATNFVREELIIQKQRITRQKSRDKDLKTLRCF